MSRVWTGQDPGAGDGGALVSQAGEWETKAHQMHELHTRVVSVLAQTDTSVWAGQTAQAWRDRVEQLAGELASFAQQLMDRSTAMRFYAGQVQQIADDARLWRVRVHEPEYRAQATTVLDRLAEERRGADAQVCAELTAVRVGSWAATAAGLEAVGVCTPGQIDPWSLTARLRDWARAFDGGPLSQRDAQALGALLRAWGSDGEAMGVFFSTLGGRGTLDLLAAICDSDHLGEDQRLSLAGLVRAGLATGSGTWGAVTAETFAAGLIDPLADATGTDHERLRDLWSVTYLLADAGNHPVGAVLATALADRVDLIERTRPEDAIWLAPPVPAVTGFVGTGLLLGYVHDQGDPADPYAGLRHDVPGLVFEHLGAHPDAALAWLTSTAPDIDGAGTAGVGRVDHWYAERDWTVAGDGFAGPTALWRGAMNATGGPAAPDGDDPQAWHRVATAMKAITDAVLTNPVFRPENLTDLAGAQLAGVLTAQIACLLEVPLREAPDGGVGLTHLPGSDDPRWVAGITREQLAALFGVATATPSGREVMTRTISTVQDALIGAAVSPGGYTPDEALHVIATLQTMLDAAPVGAATGTQDRAAARVQGVIDVVDLGLSWVKIPGLDEAIGDLAATASAYLPEHLVITAADQAVGYAKDVLTGQAGVGPWAATYQETAGTSADLDERLTDNIADWAELLQVPEVDNPSNGGSYDEYAKTVTSDYDEQYAAFENYAQQRGEDG